MASHAISLLPLPIRDLDPDARLVREAQSGSATAFDQLVRRHEPALLGFLYARLLSEEAAREVAQECLLAAWQQLGRYNGRSRFKTWLFGIATHKAVDYHRRCAALPRSLALEDAGEQLVASDDCDPLEAAARADCQLRVRKAVTELPPAQREIIELYYFAEMNLREISEVLGTNLSTLKYQFYQAHRALRPLVRDLVDLVPATSESGRQPAGRRIASHGV
jgi:RNA polymerase sigma-70 factor (ECF subfamily)